MSDNLGFSSDGKREQQREFLISKTNISAGSQMVGPVVQFGSGWEGVSKTSLHRFLTFVIECSQLGWAIKCCALLMSDKSQQCCCKTDQLRGIEGERTDELLVRKLKCLRYL